ncbi:MAG: AAA family ATPase [Alphaproteobacteria bacterium]|nr:AAA family ATPase [Alphaproteobacteria bacterium]
MLSLFSNFTTGKAMPQQIEINSQFERALDLINNTSKHLFITGKAGAGKSTLLDYAFKNSEKNMVIVAPTGVAALNVKGQTIHRFFSFPINVTPEKIKNFEVTPKVKRIYKQLQTLIIDEVSMLRADIFDCIDEFLRLYGPNSELAFGGVQLVLVGDLYQLPPVITNQEAPYFSSRYNSPYFFSSEAFRSINLEVVELTKIYRQKDTAFIELLSRIRSNSTTQNDLNTLNQQIAIKENNDTFCITLTSTNQMADETNRQKLALLPSRSYNSQAVIDGNFSIEYFPTSEVLELKEGAQIMFLNNDMKKRWVNGSLGKIEAIKLSSDKIRYLSVRLQDNAKLVEVFPYSWEIYKYSLIGKEIISDVVGSFTQFPVRLAWAVTIHKSQGQTFDNVKIDLGRGTFAPGQLYVALSRCTSLQGLQLQQKLLPRHIISDERICKFMENFQIPQTIDGKIKYLQNAAQNHQKLDIKYQKPNGDISRRIIIPINIKGNNLLAFCTQRQEQRSFNLERIVEISLFND